MNRSTPQATRDHDLFLEGSTMKRQVHTVMATVVLSALMLSGGCSDRRVEDEVRSVEWYQANKVERAAKLAQCISNPDNDATPNCINASRAENDSKSATAWGEGKEEVRTPASPDD
jgi:outer membrane murein-binding lipoprotein Lpp